jgi:hypothetical protein
LRSAEFVRIRNVKLSRFTIDRLVTIHGRVGQEVEFSFTVHPRSRREIPAEKARLRKCSATLRLT